MHRHTWSGTGSVRQQLQTLVAAARRRGDPGRPGRPRGHAALCFEPLEPRQLLAGDLVMVNDHIAGSGTDVNATSYAGNGLTSGLLKDLTTGAETAITLSIAGSGVSYESVTGTPAAGTDAYNIFDGLVDFRSASGASLAISGSDTYTHAFSGLNPDATYDFAGTAVRGNTGYTNRWTLVTLVGADAWSAAHSSGVGVVTAGLQPNQAAIWTGENHKAGQGFVAQWLDIDPGADGQFEVISQQYRGPTPGVGSGDSSSGSKGYALHGIRLVEHDASLRVVASTPDDAALLGSVPTTATIDFSFAVAAASVDASDLTVDGTPATGYTIVDSDTIQFDLPGGLEPGDHTMAIAAGSLLGESDGGPISAFSATFTLVAPATISNTAASNITADSALIGTELLATGGDDPGIVVYWGNEDGGSSANGWDNSITLGRGGPGTYSETLASLTQQTTYYFRAQATNLAGTAWASATATFTTPSITLPAVVNEAATSIGSVSARLRGTVTDRGGDTPTVILYYGDEDAGTGVPTPWDQAVSLGPQAGAFSQFITGLAPETTYYFRAHAQNLSGGVWAASAFSFETTELVPLAVVINEVHFDPDVKTQPVEFVELYNAGTAAVDLSGWSLGGGVSYMIPEGTSLAADSYLVIAQDPTAVQSKFGVTSLGPWTGRLNNDGEAIELRDAVGARQDTVDYQLGFPWPTVGDAPGPSIQLIHPQLDNQLGGSWRSARPTPGAQNRVYSLDAAPQLRHLDHTPQQPRSDEDVTITVKATDPDGVASVRVDYQLVDPGDYIAIDDPRYAIQWTSLVMRDDGTDGDVQAGDDVFTVVVPAALQAHRRLVRYRITASDTLGAAITAPYADDPQPNFAYYVYDRLPAWSGSARPGVTPPVTYDPELLESVPVYQLITTRKDHQDAQYIPDSTRSRGYTGSDYIWDGTLVYDGQVYDHIRYRARGGVWRYAMGKNMWKFDFNRGHEFQARDDYGDKYDTKWDKLNFSAIIQQGNYLHRGEQGLFESVGFKLFNLAGVEASKTNYVHFRIVESAAEEGSDQFSTDFQGIYLTTEQLDGRMLDEHDLPDGNLYKIEGYNGVLNNQGPTQPSDGSDLAAFKAGFNGAPTEQWWRENFDLERYYSYRSIVESIHHYDIAYGKNYFYYHNPETDKWSIRPWDLDLTWADNMYGSGNHKFKSLVADRTEFRPEYRSRMREIRDLLYNPEQTGMLVDEMAALVYTEGQPSLVDADRAMWDYNPIMKSSYVNSSKAGYGRFYAKAPSDDFGGMIQLLKNYVASRGAWIDRTILDDEARVPDTPLITYTGSAGFPTNGLTFTTSAYQSGTAPLAAMEWRIAEVTDPKRPDFDPRGPHKYEIESVWESGELTAFNPDIQIPGAPLEPGKTYRVRVRMKDTVGHWSHWSSAVQFDAGAPTGSVVEGLRITELNYNPYAALPEYGDLDVDNNEFEFVELANAGSLPINLAGVAFTRGIDFTFGDVDLAPGDRVVVVHDQAAFASRYDMAVSIAGQFAGGSLSNSGETIRLQDAMGGTILQFAYNDSGRWPGRADGKGASLEVMDTEGDYGDPENWRSSGEFGGSPGQAGSDPTWDVLVNEVLSRTADAEPDQIELINTADRTVDLSRWYLSDEGDDLMKFALPDGTTLASGGYLALDETQFGFGIDGQLGDDLWLIEADPATGRPLRFADHVEFDAAAPGTTLGRWDNADPAGTLFPMTRPTLGGPNSGPVQGAVIVSEIHYHPAAPPAGSALDQDALQFVEVYNRSGAGVTLGGWQIGGYGFTFPAGTLLAPASALVVVTFDPQADPATTAAFRAAFAIDASVALIGPAGGSLRDTGETIKLLRPVAPQDPLTGYLVVDQVTYDSQPPWPTAPAGNGAALERITPTAFGNFVSSWQAADPTPGTVTLLVLPGDVNGDGLVNGLDVDPFVDLLLDGSYLAAADMNGDGLVNGLDVAPFVTAVVAP